MTALVLLGGLAGVAVGIVFLGAGAIKAFSIDRFRAALYLSGVVPTSLVPAFAVGLPFLEIAVGCAILAQILHPVGIALAKLRMLVFLSTNCSPCLDLAVPLNLYARSNKHVRVTAIVAGDQESQHRFACVLSEVEVLRDSGGQFTQVMRISTVPFALIYERGVLKAKGIVNSREMLEALAEGHSRPEGDELLAAFSERNE